MARRVLFWAIFVACFLPFVTSAMALAAGVALALTIGNPYRDRSPRWGHRMIQIAVVGLGFGLAAGEVARVGAHALWYTAGAIMLTLGAGCVLWRLMRTERRTTTLVATGTAICGGSAIAAMSPAIRAEPEETAVALATVFTLNAVGLVLFPVLGRAMGMDPAAFGVWAALAIHDTSSVIGAALDYGGGAVEVATTVKVVRALWLLPLVLVAALATRRRGGALPWFLFAFIGAACLRTVVPGLENIWDTLHIAGRRLLVATIFVIGAGMSRELLARIGPRPMGLAVALWVLVSVVTLAGVRSGVIPVP